MIDFKKSTFSIIGLVVVFFGFLMTSNYTSALSMSPMKQAISLTPGDTYTGRVTIYQMGQGDEKFHYEAKIAPLTVNDENKEYYGIFDKESDYTDIANWITLSNGTETAKYGESIDGYALLGEEIDLIYTIHTPKDARGGGHYFAVVVSTIPNNATSGNVAIKESISIASVIYAEVSGDINILGTIKENNIPGFVTTPPITASFSAENKGNTHSEITYYMQVFPLFSSEEVYTTEEEPSTEYVLPGTTRYIKQTWKETPAVGIFKVRQVVYYNSVNNEPSITEKIVIVCPIWLLLIIFFVIAAIIIYLIVRVKMRKNNKKRIETA